MVHQHIYYEICTEDEGGFNPREGSFDSLQEAEKELSIYRRKWPDESPFIVRLTMTRVSKNRNHQARLKAV